MLSAAPSTMGKGALNRLPTETPPFTLSQLKVKTQQQQRKATASYFADVAQTTLMKQQNPNLMYMDFNNPNPTDDDIFKLENAYTGILT